MGVTIFAYVILGLLLLPCLAAMWRELTELLEIFDRFTEQDLDQILEQRVRFHSIARVSGRLHDDIEEAA